MLASVAWLSVSYFCTLSHKRRDFRRRFFERKICFDFLHLHFTLTLTVYTYTYIWHLHFTLTLYTYTYTLHFCPKSFLLWDIVINVRRSSCKVPVLFCPIWIKLEYSGQIFESPSNTKVHENLSSGVLVVPCGKTDMTKLIVTFRNFANAPKNYIEGLNFFL
jgi:hypothetical protein